MIIVEERLTEAFDQLPLIDGFKPVYDWGNEMHLIASLNEYAKNSVSPYPLIYQTSSESDQQSRAKECTTNLRLVLACRNESTELLNKNRWAMSYRNILFPLAQNIERAFFGATIFTWDGEYGLNEFPNYGNGNEFKSPDIWDALVFETKININANCINTINFN